MWMAWYRLDSCHMLLHARHYFCRLIFFAFSRDVSCIVIAKLSVIRVLSVNLPPSEPRRPAGGVRQVLVPERVQTMKEWEDDIREGAPWSCATVLYAEIKAA